jgi:glutamate-1-semialdehyde 2,1-aminomutase
LEITMYPALQKELDTFERRTPKSAEAHKKNLKRLPLGVASNYRAYEPYPIFVSEASGSKFRDLDGNEYLDHNLCFGTLMAGHSHPAVIKAVEGRLHKGTAYGMPHNMEWELAEEICTRFPVEMCRFGNSGTEATMHTIRLARAATGRDKIIKFEGGYHGLHDAALVSVEQACRRRVSRTCWWLRSMSWKRWSGGSRKIRMRLRPLFLSRS